MTLSTTMLFHYARIMLSVTFFITLNVVVLNVIMLSVVAPLELLYVIKLLTATKYEFSYMAIAGHLKDALLGSAPALLTNIRLGGKAAQGHTLELIKGRKKFNHIGSWAQCYKSF